jgi:glycosyltransferase involved in cell wall biosynthesis
MRIVFFSHYFPPESNAPASRTYEHAKRWVELGHQVTVVTCAPNVPNGKVYEGYKNRVLPQREVIDGIDVLRIWTYVAANNGKRRRILNYVSYLISAVLSFFFCCRRPDVIIATSPQFFCGWAGVICSYLKWCPNIVEVRDIWPESIVTVGAMNKGLVIRLLESMEKWMYRGGNHIVTVGQGYKENILSKLPNYGNELTRDKVSVITNGVDTDLFTPRESSWEFLREQGIEDQFICAYVGTIGMAHQLEVTIRAAQKLKRIGREDILFLMVGDGARRTELEKQAQEAGVSDMVRFTGRIQRDRMPEVIASCDCLLVHLRKSVLFETVIPSKIFEAMAMERPVIMGVRGEAADIVRRSNGGIDMEPENEDDLIDAVTRLADSHEFYRSLCNGSYMVSHYSRDRLAVEYLEIIKAVASGTSIPRREPVPELVPAVAEQQTVSSVSEAT